MGLHSVEKSHWRSIVCGPIHYRGSKLLWGPYFRAPILCKGLFYGWIPDMIYSVLPPFISFTLQNRVIQLHRCVTLSVKVRDPFLSFISNHINLMGPPSHFLLLRVIDRTNYLTVENTDYNTFGKLLNHR